MILLIISALGTFLYNYTLTTLGYQQDVLQKDIQISANRAQERIRVVAIWWSDSCDVLNLSILNYGRYDIKIVDVYVNNERVTSFLSGCGETISTLKLGWIGFVSPVSITPDTLYDVVIVSERGVSHVYRSEL